MSRMRSVDRWARWVALLALMLATLAPSIAHALHHARGATIPWSQLCSATGNKRAVFEQSLDGSGSTLQTDAFEHCPFCALHLGGWAPPPTAPALALRADLRAAATPARPQPQRRRFAWLAAPSRAPPLLA
jgi:Protein of unknown function (DUF2946)